MLTIVVYDSGFGGEIFADRLAAELPIAEIIRVIDWRNRDKVLANSHQARKTAEHALRPYLGKVDLVILANYLVSSTSLKYFQGKYRSQKFIGLALSSKRVLKRPTVVLTTKAMKRSVRYLHFSRQLRARTICLNAWPALIDDGELTVTHLMQDLQAIKRRLADFKPRQILLACSQFVDLEPELRDFFGHNVRLIDNFDVAIHDACRTLGIKSVKKK